MDLQKISNNFLHVRNKYSKLEAHYIILVIPIQSPKQPKAK